MSASPVSGAAPFSRDLFVLRRPVLGEPADIASSRASALVAGVAAPLEPEYEDGDDGDDAVHLKRRPWAAEEDEHLVLLVEEHGVKAWAKIAQFLHMRNGKQCRERYRNHLRPELCKGEWSVEEDTEIWNRVREVGTKWAAISELFMPTRTDNDIKNRWNSIIRKPKAPGGREWTHQETEQRMAFIGNACLLYTSPSPRD